MSDTARVRIVLPVHLRRLAKVDREVTVEVEGAVTQRAALDALEAAYPMLRGTIRDHVTRNRRPFIRFFACERDLSHEAIDTPLPDAVARGEAPFIVLGAIAGGSERRIEQMDTRRVIAIDFVSLDGVIQAPGGPEEDASGGFAYGGWIPPYSDEDIGEVMSRQMSLPFDLLLGRKTFEIWAAGWPQHADEWPGVMTATKYVASNTLTSHEWQPSVFLGGDVAGRVRQLKQQPGPDLHVYGSANLLQTLLQHDLVDEFWLKIYPLTLGGGKRLFAEGTIPAAFKVTESRVSPHGIIVVNYERAGAVKTGRF